MSRKEGHLLVDAEYPLEHGEVIIYTFDGVSIHMVTTKIQVSLLTQLPERKETTQEFHHETNVDFKTVTEFNGCDGRKLRMAQQHCSYSTILTKLTEQTKGSLYRIQIFQNMLMFATRHNIFWQSSSLFAKNTVLCFWGKSNATNS